MAAGRLQDDGGMIVGGGCRKVWSMISNSKLALSGLYKFVLAPFDCVESAANYLKVFAAFAAGEGLPNRETTHS